MCATVSAKYTGFIQAGIPLTPLMLFFRAERLKEIIKIFNAEGKENFSSQLNKLNFCSFGVFVALG